MEIDLSKPFILFAGKNGTGKTYASSFIYSFVWALGNAFYSGFHTGKYLLPVSRQLKYGVKGSLKSDTIYDWVASILKNDKTNILDYLNLGIDEKAFICEIASSREEWRDELFNRSVEIKAKGLVEKQSRSYVYKYTGSQNVNGDTPFAYTAFMLSLVFGGILGAHMFPAERNGIYTFSKEIAQFRLRHPESISGFSYPRPIMDGLANAERVKSYKEWSTKYSKLADEIESYIIHGRLDVSDDGDVSYQDADRRLTINQSSSTVKTLAPLVFYLRHMADEHNLLLIDEPEINLHPDNQVLLAKLFVKMVNNGIHLIIGTHSDYIIREINNIVMASALAPDYGDILEETGYQGIYLDKNSFSPYLFKINDDGHVNVEEMIFDQYGINMPSIDETIEDQNKRTDILYQTLKYGR